MIPQAQGINAFVKLFHTLNFSIQSNMCDAALLNRKITN